MCVDGDWGLMDREAAAAHVVGCMVGYLAAMATMPSRSQRHTWSIGRNQHTEECGPHLSTEAALHQEVYTGKYSRAILQVVQT